MSRININQELKRISLLVKSVNKNKNKINKKVDTLRSRLVRDKQRIKGLEGNRFITLFNKINNNKEKLKELNKEKRKLNAKLRYNDRIKQQRQSIKDQITNNSISVRIDIENRFYTINGVNYDFDYADRKIIMKNILKDINIIFGKVNITMRDNNGEFFNKIKDINNLGSGEISRIFDGFNDFWTDISQQTIFDEEIRDGIIIVEFNKLVDVRGRGRRMIQYYLDGVNIHCFFEPIRKYYENRMSEKNISKSTKKVYKSFYNKTLNYIKDYSKGINEKEIDDVCKSLKVSVRLYEPFNNNSYYEFNLKKSNKLFTYINTRENHLEVLHHNKEKIDIKTIDEMTMIRDMLESNKDFYIYKRNKFGINKIITNTNEYILKLEHFEDVEKFNENTGINRFSIDYTENPKLSNYIFKSTLLTNSVNFKKNVMLFDDDVKHIDQHRAYWKFKECGYYKGFPTIFTNWVKFNKNDISDIKDFLNQNIGFYEIKNVNLDNCNENTRQILQKLKYHNYLSINHNYTNTELLFLYDNGVRFELVSGMYCKKSFDISNSDMDILNKKVSIDGENEVGLYAIYSGMLSSVKFKNSYYFRTSENFARNLVCEENKYDLLYNNENKTGIFYVENENIKHKAHIGSFIYSYQRINLFQQLFKFDYNNIVKVVMDGIFYVNDTPELHTGFRVKDGELSNDDCNFVNKLHVYDPDLDNIDIPFYNKLDDGNTIFASGAGGAGKTYSSIVNNKHLNTLYVAPSYTLAREKLNEFPHIREDVYANVLEGQQWIKFHKDYNVVILDEATMITGHMKEKFMSMFPYSKIYFCGDIDKDSKSFQLPPVVSEVMNLENIDIYREYTKNYRIKCNKLRKLIDYLRFCIKKETDPKKVLQKVLEDYKDRVINMDELKDLYKIEDYILSARKQCQKHNGECSCDTNHIKLFNGLFDYKKYLITKNSEHFSNGDIIINPEKLTKNMELRNSFTIHQTQGKTIKGKKVFIYTKNFFDITMLYVAVSRVEKLDQIYFIN